MKIKVKIVEAFSSNIPDWLKKELEGKNNSLKKMFANRGVDLSNMKYIPSIPPATSNAIAKIPDNYLQVWLVRDGFNPYSKQERPFKVYIPGYTNPEVHWEDASNRSWKDYNNVDKYPKKKLLTNTVEFGYIDLNDTTNTSQPIKNKRREAKKGSIERGVGQYKYVKDIYGEKENEYGGYRTDYDNIIGSEITYLDTKGQDKSGYLLHPDKYKKMLDDVNLDTYGKRLQAYYNRIKLARDSIRELDNMVVNIEDALKYKSGWNSNLFELISELYKQLSNCIYTYNRLAKECESSIKKYDSREKIDEAIKWSFDYHGHSLRQEIESIEKEIKKRREDVENSLKPNNNNDDDKVGDEN